MKMPSNAQVPSYPRNRMCQKANFEVRKANPSGFEGTRESGNPGERLDWGPYGGVSPLHPAWIPAFAGMTISGVCAVAGMGF